MPAIVETTVKTPGRISGLGIALIWSAWMLFGIIMVALVIIF